MGTRVKPATAAWIQRERKRLRGDDGKPLSVKGLQARLALYGVNVSTQTIQVWESYAGRNPGPDSLDALERVFGTKAPDRAGATETPDSLVAALQEQTRVMSELVAELRQGYDVRLTAVEAAVALLARGAGEGSRAPAVPRVEVGSGR